MLRRNSILKGTISKPIVLPMGTIIKTDQKHYIEFSTEEEAYEYYKERKNNNDN